MPHAGRPIEIDPIKHQERRDRRDHAARQTEREEAALAHLLLRDVGVAHAVVLVPTFRSHGSRLVLVFVPMFVFVFVPVIAPVIARLFSPRPDPREEQVRADEYDDCSGCDAQDRVELVRRNYDGRGQTQQAQRENADRVRDGHGQTETKSLARVAARPNEISGHDRLAVAG